MPRLPSLKGLRAFEAAARHESFRAAAEELNVTHSAVSHLVKNLEAELQTPLFHRIGRSVKLNEAGTLYAPILKDAFERIADGTEAMRRLVSNQGLVLQVYVSVAVHWMAPRLRRFRRENPTLPLVLYTAFRDWTFDPAPADVGLIYTTDLDPRWHHRLLYRSRIYPICSPDLIADEPGLNEPADLAHHQMFQVYSNAQDWRAWLNAAGVPDLAAGIGPKLDTQLLAHEAALTGEGVALSMGPFMNRDLGDGYLVKPFDIDVEQIGAWYLVCRLDLRDDPRISRLYAWLIREIEADPAFR
jgi:LysR family transcriptional regulator, glycine cleavage system transcriptional activator